MCVESVHPFSIPHHLGRKTKGRERWLVLYLITLCALLGKTGNLKHIIYPMKKKGIKKEDTGSFEHKRTYIRLQRSILKLKKLHTYLLYRAEKKKLYKIHILRCVNISATKLIHHFRTAVRSSVTPCTMLCLYLSFPPLCIFLKLFS